MSRLPGAVLRHLAAVRAMIVFTVICGIAYPLVMTGIGQVAFKSNANGSLITNSKGQVIGSKLLCQTFVAPSAADNALNKKDDVTGYADPINKYFQPRPTFSSDSTRRRVHDPVGQRLQLRGLRQQQPRTEQLEPGHPGDRDAGEHGRVRLGARPHR